MATMTLKATSLTPALTSDDVLRSLRFYTDGLGFKVDELHEEDGRTLGAMLSAGEAKLGISQDDYSKGRDRVKGVGMSLYLETDQDIRELADRAKQAGIKLEKEAGPLAWGPMAFTVVDPDGFKLTIMNPE
ncbi:MAG TPA: VOC family protein [bacterium]|nr:VOC family protein [bacterium]